MAGYAAFRFSLCNPACKLYSVRRLRQGTVSVVLSPEPVLISAIVARFPFKHNRNIFKEGRPVGLDQLRLLSLSHWNYAGAVAQGELVVHADWADEVVTVFEALFDGGFPIERMEIVDVFEGSDDLSMAANNTSGFNCREVAFRPGVWSNHAFGTAIDINPLVNPLVDGDLILPPEAEPFIDRSVQVVGGIYAGDVVTQAFADIGWGWGGDWTSLKDWQHFSASGG